MALISCSMSDLFSGYYHISSIVLLPEVKRLKFEPQHTYAFTAAASSPELMNKVKELVESIDNLKVIHVAPAAINFGHGSGEPRNQLFLIETVE